MTNALNLLILPGDGIGREVMTQVTRVVDWFGENRGIQFNLDHDEVGGASYDKYCTPVTDSVVERAQAADAVLFGAVGGPQYDNLPVEHRAEQGLLRLRKDLDLFANLRPALVFAPLVEASTLKPEVVSGLDILILRELCGGSYFAEPRGRETLENGQVRAFDTNAYETWEIERIGRVAIDLAQKRNGKLTSAEKANVMHSGILWREVMTRIHAEEGEGVTLNHMYADNCAMQLVRNPKQFDVIVTDNLFGDLLSDCAAMLTGSLGMLPSASLGAPDPETGLPKAMYEPVHGSAPDIAGQNLANPLAQLLSFAMMLRYSFDQAAEADLVEQAVNDALASGKRTGDIMASGCEQVGTDGMTKAVLDAMDALAR